MRQDGNLTRAPDEGIGMVVYNLCKTPTIFWSQRNPAAIIGNTEWAEWAALAESPFFCYIVKLHTSGYEGIMEGQS